MTETIRTDILVIGSGIAGISLALKVSALGEVIIISKKERSHTNTNWAQGGIAVVNSIKDSVESHMEDTLNVGVGLCNTEAVFALVSEGPERLMELIEMGVPFTRHDGQLDLGREGGHSHDRVVHVNDETGRSIESTLLEQIEFKKQVLVLEQHTVIELITEHHLNKKTVNAHCFGAYVLDNHTGNVKKIIARVTILATGGAGCIYLHTTNPNIATGDGVTIAYRAGAEIKNMEFVQFHPTSLYHPKANSFLITEALRGFGSRLRLKNGNLFMKNYDRREDLAPRDVVALAIDFELKKSGDDHVLLDATHLPTDDLKRRFPNIYRRCKSLGIDITSEPIPIVPAAHYFCGGISTTMESRTSINQLYACGEVACTGVHGANRLASNSLLEAVVFSHRAFLDIENRWHVLEQTKENIPEWDDSGAENIDDQVLINHNRKELQQVMSHYVGIVRSDLRLQRAKRRVDFLKEETEAYYKKTKVSLSLLELRNLIQVASLVVESSLLRKESRGLHYMTDYPQRDDLDFSADTILNNHT